MPISVIIPAHNAERTMAEALGSVKAQSVQPDEVIVVDDASTDGTAEAVRTWCQGSVAPPAARPPDGTDVRDPSPGPKLRPDLSPKGRGNLPPSPLGGEGRGEGFLKQGAPILVTLSRNAGPAAARNQGIAQAKGEWIAFLDADDAWLPDKLAIQLAMARREPDVAMWCGGTRSVGAGERGSVGVEECGSGGVPKPTMSDERGAMNEEPGTRNSATPGSRRLRLADFGCGNPVATSTVLIRKAALEEVGGFDEQFRGPEDYDLWMRVVARFPVALIETPLARYRSLPGSLSMDDRTFLPEILKVLDKAYGPGGVLRGIAPKRRAAGYQHLACAWMAAERGAMARAWRLFFTSLVLWPWSYQGSGCQLSWAKSKLLARLARQPRSPDHP